MKFISISLFFFLACQFLLSAPKPSSAPKKNLSLDPQYQLLISEGNNFFDKSDFPNAIISYNKAIAQNPQAADAFLMIGHIHLSKKLDKIAYDYFNKALKCSDSFIFPETIIELHWNYAAVANRLKYYKEELSSLNFIIEYARENESAHHQEMEEKAVYAMGLLQFKNGQYNESKNNFVFCAEKRNYRKKSAYLFVTHFYATHNQYSIDALTGFDKKLIPKQEHRETFFNYYFYKFEKAIATQDDNLFLKSSRGVQMLAEVENYKRELESLKESEKIRKMKDRQDEPK